MTWKRKTLIFVGVLVGLILLWVGSFVWKMQRDKGRFPTLVAFAHKSQGAKALLIRHVAIYPGHGETRLLDRDVLIVDGKINAIATGGTLATQGAHILEGRGRTLLPGLIDAHTHLLSSGSAPWDFVFGSIEHNLQAYLRAGVTTVYDLGGLDSMLRDAREKVEAGTWVGPQLFHTHTPITIPNGHPIPATKKLMPFPMGALSAMGAYKIKAVTDAPGIIADLKKRKVHFVKIIRDRLPPQAPLMKPALLKALIKEAKRQKMKVFVHIGTAEDAVLAAEAGADVLAHGIHRSTVSVAQAQRIAKTGAKMSFTLHGFEVTARLAAGTYQPSPLELAIQPHFLLKPLRGARGKQFLTTPVLGDFAKSLMANKKHWKTNVMRLHKAGVPMIVGTDSALPGVFPGSSYHLELAALARAGVPPHVLLTAATSGGANLLTPKPNYGTIALGKRADLLLVEGNPLKDLAHLQKIKAVIAKGRLLRFVQ